VDSDLAYWELLSNPEIDSMARAKSASDAAALRRKGHLKEQDRLIEFMRGMHETHTCEEVMMKMERWVAVSPLPQQQVLPAAGRVKGPFVLKLDAHVFSASSRQTGSIVAAALYCVLFKEVIAWVCI
jgi:hypothetical protein